MKDWLRDRLTWMDGEIDREFAAAPPVFSRQGGHVQKPFALTISAPPGAVYYTLDGSDPRVSGAPGDDGTTTRTTLVSEDAAKLVLVPVWANK